MLGIITFYINFHTELQQDVVQTIDMFKLCNKELFDEQEKDLIRREFTKGFTQIKDSLPNIEQIDGLLNTEFTEFSIHSDKDN